MPKKDRADKYKNTIKDPDILNFALKVEESLDKTEDLLEKRNLLSKFISETNEKLHGKETRIGHIIDKYKKRKISLPLHLDKIHKKDKESYLKTEENISVLNKIKQTLEEDLKEVELQIPKKTTKKMKQTTKAQEKACQIMLAQVTAKKTTPNWYVPKAELRLLDPEFLCNKLNIKETQKQIQLREVCENFNMWVQKHIEEDAKNAMMLFCMRDSTDKGLEKLNEFAKEIAMGFHIDHSTSDLEKMIWEVVKRVPRGILLEPYYADAENPYKRNEVEKNSYVEKMVEKLSRDLAEIQKANKIQSLNKLIHAIDDLDAIKKLVKNALNKDEKMNGVYKVMREVLPQVIEQLKREASSSLITPAQAALIRAKMDAIEAIRQSTLHPVVKTKKTLLMSGGVSTDTANNSVKVINQMPVVNKESNFFKFFESQLQKSGGIGQLYTEENAKYNNVSWWTALFRGKDVINDARIKQLNDLQTLIHLIQTRDSSFGVESDQKNAAEVLFYKLLEVRNQAGKDNVKNPKLQSVPLERVCQKLMNEILHRGLKPNRSYEEALESNPLLKELNKRGASKTRY